MKHGQSYGRYSDVKFLCYFSTNNQPSYGQGFFFHSTLRLMSPLLWKPFARPAANDLFILCNILYYIYSYTWLCDILKEKIASGIVFWKEGAFLFLHLP